MRASARSWCVAEDRESKIEADRSLNWHAVFATPNTLSCKRQAGWLSQDETVMDGKQAGKRAADWRSGAMTPGRGRELGPPVITFRVDRLTGHKA